MLSNHLHHFQKSYSIITKIDARTCGEHQQKNLHIIMIYCCVFSLSRFRHRDFYSGTIQSSMMQHIFKEFPKRWRNKIKIEFFTPVLRNRQDFVEQMTFVCVSVPSLIIRNWRSIPIGHHTAVWRSSSVIS